MPVRELVNKSVLQSLSRSINTSITTLISVMTLFVFAVVFNIQATQGIRASDGSRHHKRRLFDLVYSKPALHDVAGKEKQKGKYRANLQKRRTKKV
jgi:hypothetical protein